MEMPATTRTYADPPTTDISLANFTEQQDLNASEITLAEGLVIQWL